MESLERLIRVIPDFPTPGILFRDLTPLLADANALKQSAEALAAAFRDAHIEVVAGIEARGFIFGALVATALGTGFVPLRKPGKLPAAVASVDYALEYGTARLEAHRDAFRPGQRVLVVDDVLATGGTAAAAGRLIESLGATVVGFAMLLELAALGGRARLGTAPIHCVLVA
jgi:adenine phosphoribosyltransferase